MGRTGHLRSLGPATARPIAFGAFLCLLGAAQFATTPTADAAGELTTALASPSYESADASIRDFLFDTTVQAGAGMVRINAPWSVVAGPEPPAEPRNPADPAYDFAATDRAVREADERGLGVYFIIFSAPPWAEGPDRPAEADPGRLGVGAWKPDPGALGDFATALATRYSGTFIDPASGQPLPHVRYFEAWNEPNIPLFLAPQYEGGKATGVSIYRELLRAVAAGVKAVDKGNLVIGPGLAPYGDPPSVAFRSRPFDFLRNLFCLRGKRPKPKPKCPDEPTLDIFSAHPVNSYGGPADEANSPGDAASGDLDDLVRFLRVAEQAKNLRPRGKRPLWVTEFWWVTSPLAGTVQVVDLPTQARYVAQSLYLQWKAGAKLSTYFTLESSELGLLFDDGTPRPAFDTFRFPFVADSQRNGKVLVWAKSPVAGQLAIQRESPNGWETIKQLSVNEGVFTTKVKLGGTANLRAVVGSDVSLPWGI